MSQDSCDSREREPIFIQASDIRRRLADSFNAPTKSFKRDPEDPSAAALKVTIGQYYCNNLITSLCSFVFLLPKVNFIVIWCLNDLLGTLGGESSQDPWIVSLWPPSQLEIATGHRQMRRRFASRTAGLSNPSSAAAYLANWAHPSLAQTLPVNSTFNRYLYS